MRALAVTKLMCYTVVAARPGSLPGLPRAGNGNLHQRIVTATFLLPRQAVAVAECGVANAVSTMKHHEKDANRTYQTDYAKER